MPAPPCQEYESFLPCREDDLFQLDSLKKTAFSGSTGDLSRKRNVDEKERKQARLCLEHGCRTNQMRSPMGRAREIHSTWFDEEVM